MTRWQIIVTGTNSDHPTDIELEQRVRELLQSDPEIKIERIVTAWSERDWGREARERAAST